ncbi:MAG TPA: hypothetical protein VFX97_08205 [Pyrinomonadaceae bacterium]|nr:hypothetical protein [Pyrinomonadaceae bacterium]
MYPKFVIIFFVAALYFLGAGRTPAQDGAGVRATLKFPEDKTTYRIGEPIRLMLELTAEREGYSTDIISDGTDLTWDKITISPEAGVYRWAEESLGNRGMRDYFSNAALTTKPIVVDIYLNDSIRIDRPGRYSVQITTGRVSPGGPLEQRNVPLTLTTNALTFNVVPMTNDEEEKEVKRISQLIDSARGYQAEEAAARQLAYLTGDISTREKVRRFLTPGSRSGNYSAQIYHGLFIARNRALLLQLLQAAMRDVDTPVTYSLLNVVAKVHLLLERVGSAQKAMPRGSLMINGGDPRFLEIRDAYLVELGNSLNKRSGTSQTFTAKTLLMNLPKSEQAAAALLAEVQRILRAQFDTLHPYDQEYLMRMYWEQLRDASLVPSLKKMLAFTAASSKNVHDTALKRLLEMAPDEARPYVIAQIRDPKSFIDLEVVSSLADKTLPEVDDALVDQIRELSKSKANFSRVHMKHKTSLAARFATKSIYADLMDIYRSSDDLPVEARAGFLAYFARHNEAEGLALLEQALEKVGPALQFNILPDFTKLYFSDGVGALLRTRLDSDDPDIVSTAAYLISKHGPASDQAAIEKRLQRWQAQWRGRAAEADANGQGRAERELIWAMLHAKSWKASPPRVKELQQSCVTTVCKQHFRLQN